MEISSHALAQDRCAGVRLHTAAFTNLTRDHLDYHGDMARYGEAKAKLFAWPQLRARVLNIDDAFGRALAERYRPLTSEEAGPRSGAAASLWLTSRQLHPASAGNEYVFAQHLELTADGLELEVDSSRGSGHIHSALRGAFNAENLLTSLAVLLAWEVPIERACALLARCAPAPGRLQPEGGAGLPLVLIDYAHTPDALSVALAAARAHCRGRLWCVFGCGGERDVGKRAQMGRIAAEAADELIVTDDNPRREDPRKIVAAIVQGVQSAGRATPMRVIHDRAQAIGRALEEAVADDVVLVAGKGHEDYQLVGAETRPFSDTAWVRAALAARAPLAASVRAARA
jgi:UDP-N-acetylmuramoyl-L-alanyl-D-glutamate--2,6-diaminopimelate ligase